VFSIEWSENQFDWFVDGERFFTLRDKDWFTESVSKNENKLAPFDRPFYLMLNLAVGGDLPIFQLTASEVHFIAFALCFENSWF